MFLHAEGWMEAVRAAGSAFLAGLSTRAGLPPCHSLQHGLTCSLEDIPWDLAEDECSIKSSLICGVGAVCSLLETPALGQAGPGYITESKNCVGTAA